MEKYPIFSTILLIILAIASIGMIWFGIVGLVKESYPTYKIYEYKCEKIPSICVVINKTFNYVPCYDQKGNEIINETCKEEGDDIIYYYSAREFITDTIPLEKGFMKINFNKTVGEREFCLKMNGEFYEERESCGEVEVEKKDFENYTLDDCYNKYWDGNSSRETDAFKNYMICTNILSPYMHQLVVNMRDGDEYKDEPEWYLQQINCSLNIKCGNYTVVKQ